MAIMFCIVSVSAQKLTLTTKNVAPGATITVQFTAPASYGGDAWVGIIPSSAPHGSEAQNDGVDISYQYLEKRTSGTLTFTAPDKQGSYDFRMHDTDNNGREVASVSFTVGTVTVTNSSVSLTLPKKSYKPGETISLQFTASSAFPGDAWVGIIPSSIQHGSEDVNDQNDITYQYLEKRTSGTLTFAAPDKAGNYDFRMHDTDNNGKEVSSVTFTVGSGNDGQSGSFSFGTSSMSLNKTAFEPGEKIVVTFTAPSSFASSAWIGIIPSNITHGSEAENDKYDLTYQYLEKKTSGTLTFIAPTAAGNYDLRMNDNDDSGKEIGSVTFTVR